MSRTGVHAIILFCLLGIAYCTGKSHGVVEVGEYCVEVLEEINDRLSDITGGNYHD